MSGQPEQGFENRYLCKNGSVVDMLWSAHWSDAEKSMFCVARDITERKRGDEERRSTEERTRLIINTAYDAYVAMNAEGRITDWNRAAETIFGWSRDEAVGQPLHQMIIPQQYREAHQRGLQHFLATGEGPALNTPFEIMALHRDGHEFPVELTISPIRWGETYIFSAFLRDITERQQAEEKLQQSEIRLTAAQALAHMGSWEWDIAADKILWSDEMYRIFGLTPQEFQITYDAYPKYVYPEDRTLVQETVARTLEEKGSFAYDHRIVRPDGTVRVIHGRGEIILDGSGQTQKMVESVQDITESKQVEQELQRAKEVAEEASLAKSQFISQHEP